MKTVVVTGGAGFIGSNIVHTLLKKGYKVRVVDNLMTGKMENLKDVIGEIEFTKGDIRNIKTLKKVFKNADYVLHQAALPSVPRSITNPKLTHAVNVDGTFNVLLAAKDAGVKKVVLASSSSIYGNRNNTKSKKEILRSQPLSPYAVTKIIGEYYAKVFAHIYGLPTVCLRYFNVFGRFQDPDSEYSAVIPKFMKNVMYEETVIIYGDGRQMRDFTHVDNVVEANILAMENGKVKLGESINIACGGSITINSLAKELHKIFQKEPKIKHKAGLPGEIKYSKAHIHKAKKLLGYKPKKSFRRGLKETVEWFISRVKDKI